MTMMDKLCDEINIPFVWTSMFASWSIYVNIETLRSQSKISKQKQGDFVVSFVMNRQSTATRNIGTLYPLFCHKILLSYYISLLTISTFFNMVKSRKFNNCF